MASTDDLREALQERLTHTYAVERRTTATTCQCKNKKYPNTSAHPFNFFVRRFAGQTSH
jgi:hypothetical protein